MVIETTARKRESGDTEQERRRSRRPRLGFAAIALAGAATAAFAVSCDVGRNPANAPTDLVGIFDPNAQGRPVAGLVDFSLSLTGSIPLAVGQAVFGDVAIIPYPDKGTCEGFDSIRPRAAVTSLDFDDAGDYVNLVGGGTTFTIGRDPADPSRYFVTKFGGRGFLPATLYDVVAPGGSGIDAFDAPGALRTPADFDVSSPNLKKSIAVSLSAPADLEVVWGPPGDPEDSFVVRIQVETVEKFRMIVCHSAETGRLTVPASLLGTLPEGTGALIASRATEGFIDLPNGKRAAATSEINRVGTVSVAP